MISLRRPDINPNHPMKDKHWRILLIVLLLPLLFINIKDSHDWGDDFAQYILQARNIVEGRSQADNGLIFFSDQAPYAIEAYPAGFPLMIAPVYAFCQLHFQPYMVVIAVTLILCGLFCFNFFKRNENAFIAFLMALLFCYNPTVLDLKKQILSELPFTSLLMFSIYFPITNFYYRKSSWISGGLIFGLLISIRLIGILVLLAFVLSELNKILRKNNSDSLLHTGLTVFESLFIFYGLNSWIFHIDIGKLFGFYSGALKSNSIRSAFNFDYYYDVLRNFFPFWSISVSAIWIFCTFTGWFIRFLKFRSIAEYFFPLYLILIIFYPYSSGGYRLLLPVLPLLIYYFYYFLNWLFYWFGKVHHKVTPAVLGICLLAYIPNIIGTVKNQDSIENGPNRPDATEMFKYLSTVDRSVPVMFSRARAIYLFSGHRSLYPIINQDYETALNDISSLKNVLIVVSTNPTSQAYDRRVIDFVKRYKEMFKAVWKNEGYEVYQLNT
jgi:tetrahydromethanopterin S-methyltransferase subunit F